MFLSTNPAMKGYGTRSVDEEAEMPMECVSILLF